MIYNEFNPGESIFVRAREGEHIGQFIRLGEGNAQLCEIEPRPIYLVTVQVGEQPEEIIGTFDNRQAAIEAAEALDKQIRAELGNEGNGPRLATRDGRKLQ